MSNTKTAQPSLTDSFGTAAMRAGLLLMTVATTLGMIEMPDRANRTVLPNQPAFVQVTDSSDQQQPTPLRTEREETAPHFITYSTVQRTPSRTGRM